MKNGSLIRRAAVVLPALGLAGALAGCGDDLLTVDNPGAVNAPELMDSTLIAELSLTALSDFQRAYDMAAYAGAILGDEAITGHNFTQWQEIDLRIVDDQNDVGGVYSSLQVARSSAEGMTERLRELLGADAGSSLYVARTLAFAGYSNLMLAETVCAAPVDPESAALSSDEIMQRALGYFDEAITVSTNAGVSYYANVARVGAARASLWLGDYARAVQYASQVPADFSAWLQYDENKDYQYNLFYGATHGTNRNLGVDAEFRGLNDPRIMYEDSTTGHNQLTILYTPYQPPSYSEFDPSTPAEFSRSTDIRFASGLEARYIVAEAQAAQGDPDAAIALVNERVAAYGGETLAATAGPEAALAALREQRSRDFFLDGHRLGDLRRYKEFYGVDEFPQGEHPTYGTYRDAECFVMNRSERIGNPAVD